jgi:hypothetical protein
MQDLQRLLVDSFHRHRIDATTPIRFEHRLGIRAVRLVAAHIRPHVLPWQQTDAQLARLTPASPIVSGATRLHHHLGLRRQPVDESFELRPRQPFAVDNPSHTIRHSHFEDVLCQIYGDRRSIHLGLLLVAWCDPRFTAMMPRKHREESIPSLKK